MSAPLVGPNHNGAPVDLVNELRKCNFSSVSERRIAVMAERLDAALTGAIQLGDDKPMPSGEWVARCAAREVALRASQGENGPLSDADARAIEAWRIWRETSGGKPEPEIVATRGRTALAALDSVVESLGAAFEELTGTKPARWNREIEESGRSVTKRGGGFLAFASAVMAGYALPDATLLSDARVKAVVARRKRSRLKL